ncbi:MAG: exodeoxyribonuclease VII small subunit [Proteobacteria bacterium]|nr:exodeoxyribonuclease VII small subunit [Pseudomonadota bacterium]
MASKSKKIEDLSFEEILQNVESTINKLQTGEMELDKSIEEFKDGLSLIKHAKQRLDSAKLKVQEVLKEDGELICKDIKE